MKKTLTLLVASLLVSTGALAADGYDRGKDNHEEATGGHGLYEAKKQKSTPEAVKRERELQKNTDPGKGNHEEMTGGHALHELKKQKPATAEQMKIKRENEKTLNRGKDNHEEGVGGHGLYEATKK